MLHSFWSKKQCTALHSRFVELQSTRAAPNAELHRLIGRCTPDTLCRVRSVPSLPFPSLLCFFYKVGASRRSKPAHCSGTLRSPSVQKTQRRKTRKTRPYRRNQRKKFIKNMFLGTFADYVVSCGILGFVKSLLFKCRDHLKFTTR